MSGEASWGHGISTVSVDEKPGVQARGLTAPDLPLVPDQAVHLGRADEYVRQDTVSILAGIDRHSCPLFKREQFDLAIA